MATDFFERQSRARKSTQWLIAMFVLSVLAIVGSIAGLTWYTLSELPVVRIERPAPEANDPFGGSRPVIAAGFSDQRLVQIKGSLVAGGAALALILLGTLYKLGQLRGGGSVVAESMGGKRIYPNANGLVEQRLLNVVEEMALASGVPVPPVYLLEQEQSINAFAAGYAPSDAVVAVTRGCAEQLTRDELQGVVAHEFSHVLNGDMRLNIRLIGVLHGILLIGLIGRILLRTSGHSRRDSKEGGGLVMIGLAMFILGYLGTMLGGLIKAAVSRQREYLADSSAVQFTRNPTGLSGALKKIGGLVAGSKLEAPNAAEASHMFFAQGVWEGLTSLTATHPPLRSRILALEPNWNGKFLAGTAPSARATSPQHAASGAAANLVGAVDVGEVQDTDQVSLDVIENSAEQVGEPTELHRTYAAELVAGLPPEIVAAVHEPYGARAVLLCLLTDQDSTVRQAQLVALEQTAKPDLVVFVHQLLPTIDQLDARVRLPLIDMAMPALRAMSESQYHEFCRCFQQLVAADNRLALFEWTLYQIILRHLRPQFEKTAPPGIAYYGLQRMGEACSVLLSTLAHADNRRAAAPAAFERGASQLHGVTVELLPPEACGLDRLSKAIKQFKRVASKQRKYLVEACAATICADQDVTVAEAELFRGICDMLDCPMPPLLPGQPVPQPDIKP